MKKWHIIISLSIVFFMVIMLNVSVEAATEKCYKHGPVGFPMIKVSNTTTCTSDGKVTYRCVTCKMFNRDTTKVFSEKAYGHRWSDTHKCIRCSEEMKGHYFKRNGSSYSCIVCKTRLTLSSMSPNLAPMTGYRVSPYDRPTPVSGRITVIFSAVPYNENGQLMKVTATATSYVAKNSMYHWGEAVSEEIAQNVYPPYYKSGKGILEGGTQSLSVSQNGDTCSISTGSSGKYIFRMYLDGSLWNGPRRYVKGSSSSDDSPTNFKENTLTIKHINKDTNTEIIDNEYSKKIKIDKDEIPVFSLPLDDIKYNKLANISYKINDGEEIDATSKEQYIVKLKDLKEDTTIIFYYSEPSIKIKHVLENTGEEIVDKEYTKTTAMLKPSTVVFSLDVGNKYPILYSSGYALDGERVNREDKSQYAVNVPWRGANSEIIFYYKYSDVNVTVNVKHIDTNTGELMKGTTEKIYNGNEIPVSVSSLDLSGYAGYENSGVYMDGKYTKKSGKSSYSMAIDISTINYSKTYAIIFYYSPSSGSETFNHEIMNPIPAELSPEQVSKIASNTLGKEIYDVKDSIPTSENVYATVRLYNYIFRYGFDRVTNNGTYKVTFIQPYLCNGTTTNVTTVYEIPVRTEYYKLAYLEVYSVESATLINKVLPGESVKLIPKNSTLPAIVYEVPETYVKQNDTNKTITLPILEIADMKYAKSVVGSTEYAMHEAGAVEVRNDKLIIEGKTVTSSEWVSGVASKPNKIYPSIMAEKTLYKEALTISDSILNGEYESAGNAVFVKEKNINGKSNEKISVALTPNEVVVHTPVVNNTVIDNSNSVINNQKINSPSKSGSGETAKILVLDQKFKLTISNSGTHKNSKGYGTRMYNYGQGVDSTSFAKAKQVKFPFDVYFVNGSSKIFIPKNTWYDLSVAKETFEFLLPAWVKEGSLNEAGDEYFIETRIIAENGTDKSSDNVGYNADINSYVASKRIFVEVVGRLYEFLITGTNDPSWKLENPLTVAKQPIGQNAQNKFNSAYKYALKLGYSVAFDVKTIGTKSDSVEIKPTKFWYVDKSTNNVEEVDLYYHTTTQRYIKIGAENDKSTINSNLSSSIRNVLASEKVDSLRIHKNKYNYTINNNIGTFAKLTLPMAMRMSYNNIQTYLTLNQYGTSSKVEFLETISKSGVKEDDVINSIGHWYGEYRLPSSTLAIPKGKVANANSEFLKNGYIIVQFDIESNYQDWDYLSYSKPSDNTQWQKENANLTINLPNGKTVNLEGNGVAIVYEANIRANNDYETGGTH